ncbi:exodeoxyribonuclease V subunit alpha [Marinobacter salinisoli]|uniref:RecBCD enzyme subunit RecD n=1 Tax=Marinobacter salinisoli TaxID=2769486 RepID=A0ABX7MTE4_9GAMM|nr:exodeoxyribonuclease V subunit alpha [Marinobacter salinisoli]QSP95578.1 exodeoxyribonuclease V subunit alpha [Marinobacter salinisoli]
MSTKKPSDLQYTLELEAGYPERGDAEPQNDLLTPQAVLGDAAAMMTLLAQWRDSDWLRALDVEFARFLGQLSHEQAQPLEPVLILLSALVSHQVGRGHVCLDLDALLSDPRNTLALPPEESPGRSGVEPSLTPADLTDRLSLDQLLSLTSEAHIVSEGSLTTPLIMAGSRLYLRRFWRYEQQIAAGILARLSADSELAHADTKATRTLSAALSVLFSNTQAVDYQKLACALAARNRFSVITGGPGTGKTTTVVKLLAALQSVAGSAGEDGKPSRKLRIRLAAPTGKAAARLNESIGGAVSRLPFEQLPGELSQHDIPTQVTTLHRLLGSRPDSRRFRHNRDNPLLLDILVIDEASMVDVDLMASVFEALPDHAQLILLGDKDQLASVDAGAVLGELCQRASRGHYTQHTARWLEQVTGTTLPDTLLDPQGQTLDQAVAMLRKSYRFGAHSGIGTLAEAVNTNTLDEPLLTACRDQQFDDVSWVHGRSNHSEPEALLELIARHALSGSPETFAKGGQGRQLNDHDLPPPVGYRHYLSRINEHQLDSASPRADWDGLALDVLEAFSDFQVLCALRQGPWGVEGLNDRIARELLAHNLIPRAEGWYAGRPVLITGNDYNLGLMNGDIGITLAVPWDQDEQGNAKLALRVAFPASDGSGGIRWISPSRLQQLETVYAMTVHKSQGSEFTHTCLVLPDRLSPVMTRELVYTGITRARHWFSLVTGDAGVFRDSVRQRVVRASGLAQLLSKG